MSLDLVSEDDLRAALRPYRADRQRFEADVRARLVAFEGQGTSIVPSGFSPLVRAAAAFLPLPAIAGGQAGAAVKLAPEAGAYKLLSYLAFPAISLFVLLGATVFSVARIRKVPTDGAFDAQAAPAAIKDWWRHNRFGAIAVYGGTVGLAFVGATWVLFLVYILSFGLLVYVLTSFARYGLANRFAIGQSCLMGLMFLAQVAVFPSIGVDDIQFLDPAIIATVFYGGALALLAILAGSVIGHARKTIGLMAIRAVTIGAVCLLAPLLIGIIAWFAGPILRPATPARIKAYVESFDHAPFSTANWREWEIVASWAVEAKLNPDLEAPRRLLAKEIAGEQNPYILNSALSVGLLAPDQVNELRFYQKQRKYILGYHGRSPRTDRLSRVDRSEAWVIRAAVLRNELSPEDCDFLEKRLHYTLDDAFTGQYRQLENVLDATQLLALIGRPVDPDRYRDRVHAMLREFHSTTGGGFQLAGGFVLYQNSVKVGDLDATSCAVELMETYGVPGELDLNWVRSFLRPRVLARNTPGPRFIAAVTLNRLNAIPGVTHPSWLDMLYYERSLLAAVVLVGLCVYATLRSPNPVRQTAVPA